MAYTTFATSDVQAVKLWSKKTLYAALEQTLFFKKFLGATEDSILYWVKDLEKTAGDQVVFDLLVEMTGNGVTGDNTLKGNEEQLTYYQEAIKIDQLRQAHAFKRMSQQRTVHDLRKDGQWALSRWWATKFEESMFRVLCGDTTVTGVANTPSAPNADNWIFSGNATAETTGTPLAANDEFTLQDIDYAKERAQTLSPPIRPVRIDGDEYYVVVLHPYSAVDLRLTTGTASPNLKWSDIQQYANQRGLKNPLFTGSLGVYNKCIIYESKYIHTPSAGVRRNLFLGAQAGVFAMGNAYSKIERKTYGDDNLLSWYEQDDDYGNTKGIAAGCVFGMDKTKFNSKDFGAITISSYAVQHS